MLTIKQITENTDAVIRGLEKKHFKGAKETIAQVIEVNDKRRNTQNQLDKKPGRSKFTFENDRSVDERRQKGRS